MAKAMKEENVEYTGSPVPNEIAIIHRTLPELVSGFIKGVMENPANLNQCGRDLQLWHDAQPLENRQQLVRDTKKAIETAKLSMEWLFSEYQRLSAKDM